MLSPNPLTFFGGIEAAPAIEFARATNDAMAALVARNPDRLLGSAQLPMQDPEAAVVELERAICELGLVAGYIGTDYGATLDDRRFDDVYRRVVELDVPLFVHGVTHAMHEEWHVEFHHLLGGLRGDAIVNVEP